MATKSKTPQLDSMQQAIARGDLTQLRAEILNISGEEEEILAQELGLELFERTRRLARRGRRGLKRGHVVVVHGIMGSMLDVIDPSGDCDRVWIHALRLMAGRMEDLELGPIEQSLKPKYSVVTAGLHRKTYIPLLLELDESWEVRPFAFDWRKDIEQSADQLASEIRAFAKGKPVHLVAHSMGGLVSRSMIKRHPDLWIEMEDPSSQGAGGRLIMLGTPNHGSFAIPLAFSGQEWLVRALAIADVTHSKERLLEILTSFPGSYQMLPSPLIPIEDEHDKLYRVENWGSLPIREALLQKGKLFHENLRDVVDNKRFIYVAGFNQKTPFRIRIETPGRFQMQKTADGDGRVPHALGVLAGVPTFWVEDSHGDLPRNAMVLDCIQDLLINGHTDLLERSKPSRRSSEDDGKWIDCDQIDADIEWSEMLRKRSRVFRRHDAPDISLRQALEIEGAIAQDYLGLMKPVSLTKAESKPSVPLKIKVEVLWGDISRVEGDVYAVGHYQGVLPQYAEKALDVVVSNRKGPLVITEHTRRGLLRGALGEVYYFPWRDSKRCNRLVAVAGMGRPGTFSVTALRRLIRELVLSISTLPNVRTICSVLIGSGEGTLIIADAVRGLLEGIVEAIPAVSAQTQIEKICIVEKTKGRAHEILNELKQAAKDSFITKRLLLNIKDQVVSGKGGKISDEAALLEVLEASSRAVHAPKGAKSRKAVETMLESIADLPTRNRAREALLGLNSDKRVMSFAIGQDSKAFPTRISILEDKGMIRVAAITEMATVSERPISVDPKLIREIVAGINDPDNEPQRNFSTFLLRLVFPRDFRNMLENNRMFVFELDRVTAPIHWEMMARSTKESESNEPIGVVARIARQLRTTYSPAPVEPKRRQGPIKALLVGDPGDPKEGLNLPGAREEAIRVYEILKKHEVEVTALIGSPSALRRGLPSGSMPATRVEVLNQLMHDRWDILHYCGHGDFEPKDPRRAGWVFTGGLLTASEIERLDEVPSLVVANACLSGRTSQTIATGDRVDLALREAGLLPSLADEFFHLGVRNYIGTSWEVNDIGAVEYAQSFYGHLLEADSSSRTIGDAMLAARKVLWNRRDGFGKLWAAYQHYGDPTTTL